MSIGAANKRQYQRIALWQWVELNPNVEHGNKGGGALVSNDASSQCLSGCHRPIAA